MNLNKYFDRAYCVCLPQRKEMSDSLEFKLNDWKLKLRKYIVGIDYIDVDAPFNWHGRNSQSYNYMQCFFNIIEEARDNNLKSILYFEDDVHILPHFEHFMPIIMENVGYWDMIYFGPGHHNFEGMPSNKYELVYPFLTRSELHLGMQCVAIHETMYSRLLSLKDKWWINENPYIDITIAHQFHKGNHEDGRAFCYSACPYLVCETSGMSYNERVSVKRPEYELWKDVLV